MCKLPKVFLNEFGNIPTDVDKLVYVRDENRKKIGVVIIDNGFCGWSLWNQSEDEWDLFMGIYTAYERLLEGKTCEVVKKICFEYIIDNYKGGFAKSKEYKICDILHENKNLKCLKK